MFAEAPPLAPGYRGYGKRPKRQSTDPIVKTGHGVPTHGKVYLPEHVSLLSVSSSTLRPRKASLPGIALRRWGSRHESRSRTRRDMPPPEAVSPWGGNALPNQEQAYRLVAALFPDPELLLASYRHLGNSQYHPRSWLQAVAYIAAGGKCLDHGSARKAGLTVPIDRKSVV